MTFILVGSTLLLHVVFHACFDKITTQLTRMAANKSSLSSHSACIDYEVFAIELHKNPCIWDLWNDNYNLVEY